IVDLAVPRNVEPTTNSIENVYLYNLEDLHHIVQKNLHHRHGERLKAEALIALEVEQFVTQMRQRTYDGVLQKIEQHLAPLIEKEFARTLQRLDPLLTASQRHAIENLRKILLSRILELPARYLHQQRDPLSAEILLQALSPNTTTESTAASQ